MHPLFANAPATVRGLRSRYKFSIGLQKSVHQRVRPKGPPMVTLHQDVGSLEGTQSVERPDYFCQLRHMQSTLGQSALHRQHLPCSRVLRATN
eukprot:scaffold4761_cov205-Amphora_coffeaeformis.AAC.11